MTQDARERQHVACQTSAICVGKVAPGFVTSVGVQAVVRSRRTYLDRSKCALRPGTHFQHLRLRDRAVWPTALTGIIVDQVHVATNPEQACRQCPVVNRKVEIKAFNLLILLPCPVC